MCIYCCICDEGPAQLCAKPGFAPPASFGSSPGCRREKVTHGMLLYFSPWPSPFATSGGGWEDSMWKRVVFPYLPLLPVNGDLPAPPPDKTGRPRWRRRKKSPKHSMNV